VNNQNRTYICSKGHSFDTHPKAVPKKCPFPNCDGTVEWKKPLIIKLLEKVMP